jgi:uncharacterized protein (DUF1501 family)
MRRRDALKLGLAALACVPFGARSALSQAPAPRDGRARTRPRYVMSLFLSGGIDAITTTDPKTRADVEAWVDVPYAPGAIVDAGGLRLGPHFAPLAKAAPRIAIVNGVQVRTANHNTGREQFLRMRTGTRADMPTLLQVIGLGRDTQAVGCMTWQYGAPQFQALFDDTSPDDLRRIAAALRPQSKGLGVHGPEGIASGANVDEAATLLERVAKVERIKYETWSADGDAQRLAQSLQRALWAFENDLTRAFELNVGGIDQPWDTHSFNTERQTKMAKLVPIVARFFAELEKRRTSRGALVDETLVVMGSEIGRYPGLNGQMGKDHLPEIPLVFFGAGVDSGGKGASYGRTGKKMESVPIALATGRDAAAGHTLVLDDVGTTLLRIAGVGDPSVYGYRGAVLDFLTGGA